MQFEGLFFFFAVMCIGYLAPKLKLVSEEAVDVLPGILLNVCFPAMLLNSFSAASPQALLTTGLPTAVTALIFSLLPFFLCRRLLRKREKNERTLLCYYAGIGNISFVCVPLMRLFLSENNLLIVFFFAIVQDFLIWAVHHQIFLGNRPGAARGVAVLRKVLLSPCLLAVIAGIVLCLCSVKLPAFLAYTTNALEAAVSPLSLLFVGMLAGRYGLFSWVRDRTAIVYSILRVLVYPAVVYFILQFFMERSTAVILALMCGGPAPFTGVVWCKQYDGSTELAVHCVIPSTLLYLIAASGLLIVLTHGGILS